MACGCNSDGGSAQPASWTLDYGRGVAPNVLPAPSDPQPGRAPAPSPVTPPLGTLVVWLVIALLVWRGLTS